MVQRAVAAAESRDPALRFSRAGVDLSGPQPVVIIASGKPEGPQLRFDGRSGQLLPPPPPKQKNFHYALQDLHAGYFLGLPGRIISTLLGLCVLVLSVTGIQVYLDMLHRRRAAGRAGWFWSQ